MQITITDEIKSAHQLITNALAEVRGAMGACERLSESMRGQNEWRPGAAMWDLRTSEACIKGAQQYLKQLVDGRQTFEDLISPLRLAHGAAGEPQTALFVRA